MADFLTKQTISTGESVLKVESGLPVGIHRFQLVVVDDSGRRSKPAEIEVTIYRTTVIPGPIDPLPLRPIG